MSTFLIIVAIIVGYLLIRFVSDLSKDSYDLQDQALAEKFSGVVNRLNGFAYEGGGTVTPLDKRSFNLYRQGSNQIVNFHYSTGHLTISWKYKYLQKEVVHERQFNDVRNVSLIEQARIADQIIEEMTEVVGRHQSGVLSGQ